MAGNDKPEAPKTEGDKGAATATQTPEAHPELNLVTLAQTTDKPGAQPAPAEAALEHKGTDYMTQMWDQAVAANGGKPLQVVKGYYEAGVHEVDGAAHPNGLVISTSESDMTLKSDVSVKYADGTTENFKAGSKLPNGYQLSPKEMSADGETRTMNGATLIKTGPKGEVIATGDISGSFVVDKGQFAKPESFVVSRPSTDLETGKPRIDTYTNKDLSRWVDVPGQPGVYSPKLEGAQPVGVIKVPEGKTGTFDVSYGGTAPFKPGDLIVREDKTAADGVTKVPAYRRISEGDGLETYRGADAAGTKALDDSAKAIAEKYPDAKVVRAAADGAEFQAAQIRPEDVHRSNDFMKEMWDQSVAANGGKPLSVIKGYYEAGVRKVDGTAHPEGLILSSTESTMTLKSDMTVKYADGTSESFKAGSKLPNGYQLSPRGMSVDGENRTMDGATLIKTGPTGEVLKTGEVAGSVVVNKGQFAPPEGFIVSRPSTDLETGKPRIDTYTNKDLSRWVEVPGKAGVYSPKLEGAAPVGVIKVPEGKTGTFDVSYGGTAPFKPGDLIVREDKTAADGVTKVPAFRRISEGDGLETYRGADAAGTKALDESSKAIADKYPGAKITRAAADAASFHKPVANEIAFGDAFAKPAAVPKKGPEPAERGATLDLSKAIAPGLDQGAKPVESEELGRVRKAMAAGGFDENTKRVAAEEVTRLAEMSPAERASMIAQAKEIVKSGRGEEVAKHDRAGARGFGGLLYLTPQALEAVAGAFGL